MLKNYLPDKLDPFRAAMQATHLQGELPVKNMERLCASLCASTGEVQVSMEFGIDEQDICVVKGRIQASLMLQCNRCMEPFNYEIVDDFTSAIIKSEEETLNLPQEYDFILVKEGVLLIEEMIEEELIVSLPIVPKHETANCKITLPYKISAGEGDDKSDNPFKVIEFLRSKTDNFKKD